MLAIQALRDESLIFTDSSAAESGTAACSTNSISQKEALPISTISRQTHRHREEYAGGDAGVAKSLRRKKLSHEAMMSVCLSN